MQDKINAVKAFHTAFKIGHRETPKANLGIEKNMLRYKLMREENEEYLANNGAVLTIAQIVKLVMSSAAQAELGALYINSRETAPQRHLLEEMGHPQPPTPIQVDNTTVY